MTSSKDDICAECGRTSAWHAEHRPRHPFRANESIETEDARAAELDEWRRAHRQLAESLGATSRGRDHVDAMLAIAAIKRAFGIIAIAIAPDASEVRITAKDGGEVIRVPFDRTEVL